MKKISELSGVSEKDVRTEIERRILVLSWLQKHNVTNYVDVYKVFSLFYNDTQRLLSIIEREL